MVLLVGVKRNKMSLCELSAGIDAFVSFPESYLETDPE